MSETLTREEAYDTIAGAEAAGISAYNAVRPYAHRDQAEQASMLPLTALYKHWIGHDDHGQRDRVALAAMLYDYVDEAASACTGDEERSNGPKLHDPTDLEPFPL